MSNRPNLERALKCFADPQKRDEYFELYSDDIVLHGYGGVQGPGLNNVKQFYMDFWNSFPDARVTAEEIVEQGEALVVRHVTTGKLEQISYRCIPKPLHFTRLFRQEKTHFPDLGGA